MMQTWQIEKNDPMTATNLEEVFDRSSLYQGDRTRLWRVMERAERGEAITVGVLGGSITMGAQASEPEYRYANHVLRWWQEQFPQAKFTLINAGIGATSSDYGALRVKPHLLAAQPDFVVVEYGVNDLGLDGYRESYEGVLRQILKQPNEPAIMLLFMVWDNGTSCQEGQAELGEHYQLPMVSFRDAFWPEVENGNIAWDALYADYVHPNDTGHAWVGRFVASMLKASLAEKPAILPNAPDTPAPLVSDVFEFTQLEEGALMEPVMNEGWERGHDIYGHYFEAAEPGASLEFEIAGSRLFVMYYRIQGAMGQATVSVDGEEADTLEGWYEQTWGGYRATRELPGDFEPGTHRIRIEIAKERNLASDGHLFRIYGIGAAGVRD